MAKEKYKPITGFFRLTFIPAGSKKPKKFWVTNPLYKGNKIKTAIFTQVTKEGDTELHSEMKKGNAVCTKGIIMLHERSIIKLEPAVLSLKYGELFVVNSVETKREDFY